MSAMDGDWRVDLERWLAPYLEGLGHKARQRMCPAYVAGLIGPGDRKSIQPMAARTGEVGYDRLHHFIGAGLWDSGPLEATLWERSEEHTSELQSLMRISYAVFCLKKKIKKTNQTNHNTPHSHSQIKNL